MDRCHIVVFNADRMAVFLESFWRVRGFDRARDKVKIFDCSRHPKSELRLLEEFARAQGWRLGNEVQFIRRPDWGFAEGARIDYFRLLHGCRRQPGFIWQFQDHFLNPESIVSRWPVGSRASNGLLIEGQPKDDTIADDGLIDIPANEAVFDAHPNLGVLHASRRGLGLCAESPPIPWYFADGGNCCVRREIANCAFPDSLLAAYRAVSDGRMWTFFMELEWGRLLSATGCDWYHIGNGMMLNPRRSSVDRLKPGALQEEEGYAQFYSEYSRKVERMRGKSAAFQFFAGWTRQKNWQVRRGLQDIKSTLTR